MVTVLSCTWAEHHGGGTGLQRAGAHFVADQEAESETGRSSGE